MKSKISQLESENRELKLEQEAQAITSTWLKEKLKLDMTTTEPRPSDEKSATIDMDSSLSDQQDRQTTSSDGKYTNMPVRVKYG